MKIKLKNLQLVPELIEIRPINHFTVSKYRQAIRQGAEFPPVLVRSEDRQSVIAGAHRVTAYTDELGENHSIECQLVKAPTERNIIELAIKDNVSHGLPLTGLSKRAAAIKLEEMGATLEDLSQLFQVPTRRIEEWGTLSVVVSGTPRPLKRGAEVAATKTVTESAYKTHREADIGVPVIAQSEQITRYLREGWVDFTDTRTKAALESLYHALREFFPND